MGYFYDTAIQDTVLIPCYTDACCWARYELCRIDEFTYTKNYIEGSVGDSANCHVNPMGCEMICGILEDSGVFGRVAEPEIEFEEMESSTVVPNPTTGEIEIAIRSNVNGKARFEIVDVRGQTVVYSEMDKNSYMMKASFDLQNKANGLYFYRVYVNNRIIATGKISLMK